MLNAAAKGAGRWAFILRIVSARNAQRDASSTPSNHGRERHVRLRTARVVVENVATDEVADSASHQHVAGKVFASLDALESGSRGQTVDCQLHLPSRIFIG